jgi:hypothetical protein
MPVFLRLKALTKMKGFQLSMIMALGLSLFFPFGGNAMQPNPAPFIIKGKVINKRDSTAIPNVHIINQNNVRAATSGTEGQFRISVTAGDSLRFQAVGYETQVLAFSVDLINSKEPILIALTEKIYELPSVDIYPFKTFSEFKYAFLNFKDPEPDFSIELPQIIPEPDIEKMPPGFGVVIPGPITFLYDHFSRRGKAQRNYHNVLKQEELAHRAARVVNPRVIERLTGLKERVEINAFLIYCGITDEYVVNTREAEVYARIMACYETYLAEGK